MIAFITEDWMLDLTSHKITFVEESSLFYNYFVSNYSLPFTITISEDIAIKMGLISENNITDYQTSYKGVLQQDGDFKPAILELNGFDGSNLSGSFVYGNETLPLLETKLSDLPWPVITTTDIKNHAKETISKGFPEVMYNFPMIIDSEFSQNTSYEKFEGLINYFDGTNYIPNYKTIVDGEEVIFNRNVITPYPYIMAILKMAFESAGLSYGGDFFSDPKNETLIWDTGVFLEQNYSPLPPSYQFAIADNNAQDGNLVRSFFAKTILVNAVGSYTIKIHVNFPDYILVEKLTVIFDRKVIYTSTHSRVEKILTINVESAADYENLVFQLTVKRYNVTDSIEDISLYNSLYFWSNDPGLNVFKNVFSIADVLPNMKVSTFLNKLKNWKNLDVKISNDSVIIDYVEQKFLETTFKDETHLEVEKYPKEFNQNKAYRLKDSRSTIRVTKDGLVSNLTSYKSQNITSIDTGVDIMNIEKKNSIFTARRKQDSNFRILLYDGLKSNLPVAVSNIDGHDFSLTDIYNRFWKNWLRFRITSETIKDSFSCDIYENITTELGIYKYNKKQLIKKISKRRGKEGTWDVKTESETLG